jgi:hypothetical protein
VSPPLRRRDLLLGAVVLLVSVSLVRLGVDRAVLAHADSVRGHRPTTDGEVPVIEHLRQGVKGLVWLARLALTVAVVAWMASARRIVQTYDCGVFRSDPDFAVTGWFLPPINLVAPYLLMSDVWLAGHPGRRPDAIIGRLRVPRRIKLWWLLFLVSVGLGIMEAADRVHGGSTWAPFDMHLDYAMTVCQIVSAVLLAWIVVQATGFIERRASVASPV